MEAVQQTTYEGYEVIKANTYAKGVAKLKKLGEQPKTFKENIEARVVAYENGDRALFDVLLDSCTAIVNKKRLTRFKLVPQSTDLISIPADFRELFLPVTYDDVQRVELDSSNQKYNQGLKKDEVMDHAGWLLAVEADAHLLKTYRDIIFNGFKKEKAMGFYVRQNTEQDELRALFVGGLNDNSNAGGINCLSNASGGLGSGGSFLRGSPVVRAEKKGSAYRNPAMTEEQRLTARVEEELSRFDKYLGTFGQQEYQQDKERATKELVALLKK